MIKSMINVRVRISLTTDLTYLENGWTRLSHDDGWNAYLRTFEKDGTKRTVIYNDYANPVSIHEYDAWELVLDDEWENLYEECIVDYPTFELALTDMGRLVGPEGVEALRQLLMDLEIEI